MSPKSLKIIDIIIINIKLNLSVANTKGFYKWNILYPF